jgi:hypothetical protein
MKSVLILANDFPPKNSVGAERPYSWYKYFKKQGVKPIVITKNWNIDFLNNINDFELDFTEIFQAPISNDRSSKLLRKYGKEKFSFLRKIFTVFYHYCQYFLPVGIHYSLYQEANQYLNNNKVDFIIATGEPFILFKYASKLSRKHNVNWLADYRDDWIQNHGRTYNNNIFTKAFMLYDRFWEKKYLKNVFGITSVSDYLVNQISRRNSEIKCETIENGVDLDVFNNTISPFKANEFSIVYSGVLYDQDYLSDFSKGFTNFISILNATEKVHVYFIGIEVLVNQATKAVELLKLKFPNNVHVLPKMSQKKVANYQINANILLNFIAGDPSKGLIGAKSYVYAATKKPILTIPSIKNSNSPFFPGRKIQYVATSSVDVENFIREIYIEFSNGIIRKSDITEQEIFMLSREFNANKMTNFIFNYANQM